MSYETFMKSHDWIFDEVACSIPEYAEEVGCKRWKKDKKELDQVIDAMVCRVVDMCRHQGDDITVEMHNQLLSEALKKRKWINARACIVDARPW